MSAEPFESPYLKLDDRGGVLVVGLKMSKLRDEENVERIGQELVRLVTKYGHRKIVLDLSNVEWTGSAFLAKLITLHRKLHRVGGRLVVCGFHGLVADALRATGLDGYLQTAADTEQAVALCA